MRINLYEDKDFWSLLHSICLEQRLTHDKSLISTCSMDISMRAGREIGTNKLSIPSIGLGTLYRLCPVW